MTLEQIREFVITRMASCGIESVTISDNWKLGDDCNVYRVQECVCIERGKTALELEFRKKTSCFMGDCFLPHTRKGIAISSDDVLYTPKSEMEALGVACYALLYGIKEV